MLQSKLAPISYRALLCIAALLVAGFVAQAQKRSGYQQGYIVIGSNDTLRGSVRDRDEGSFAKLYSRIRFREEGKRKTRKFDASDISAYRRGNDDYISIWIYSERQKMVERYTSKEGIGEQFFVKVIYQGPLNYYHWEYMDEDNVSIDYVPFFKKQNGTEMVRVTQGILGLKKKRLYEFFADCPSMVNAIQAKTLKDELDIIDMYEFWCAQ